MLKIIALIECDLCNGVLSEIAAAEKTGEKLNELIHNLQITSEEHGWQPEQNSTVHHCRRCCSGE
jgi:hypothetical protein